jgi:LytS/YehU family sensor histidine kinase
VQAINNDGIAGEPKLLLTITITPAWYQAVWFKLAAVLTGIFLLSFLYRQHRQKEGVKFLMVKQQAELRQQEAEVKQLKTEFEKRLAQTEMATLRSQMNPHFIFNCLNSIKLYTMQNDTKAATEYLSKFSKLIRLVLENSRTATIPLASELEALQLYMDMEVMRFKQKLSYTISVAEDVDASYIEIPPLLLQPYVENAIWHGLMQKEEGGHIAIAVAMHDAATLVIIITDNGIGRAKAAELRSKTATAKKSFGMKVTSERIALVNRIYHTTTSISIHDLVDGDGQPAGTEVTLKIPLHDNDTSHHC